jgi:hypothetical protein
MSEPEVTFGDIAREVAETARKAAEGFVELAEIIERDGDVTVENFKEWGTAGGKIMLSGPPVANVVDARSREFLAEHPEVIIEHLKKALEDGTVSFGSNLNAPSVGEDLNLPGYL